MRERLVAFVKELDAIQSHFEIDFSNAQVQLETLFAISDDGQNVSWGGEDPIDDPDEFNEFDDVGGEVKVVEGLVFYPSDGGLLIFDAGNHQGDFDLTSV